MTVRSHLPCQVDDITGFDIASPAKKPSLWRDMELIEIRHITKSAKFLRMVHLPGREQVQRLKFLSPDPEPSGPDRADVLCHIGQSRRGHFMYLLP